MVLLSVASAAVVLAVRSPASHLGRVLGWQPLRWIGVRSYGIYLWHYPIIVLTTPAEWAGDAAPGHGAGRGQRRRRGRCPGA